MTVITDQTSLTEFCRRVSDSEFITVDTEFLRDKTYYPQLCLIQMAAPEGDPVAVDPLCSALNLEPVYELMFDEKITKVFHAARQDLEIFFNLTGKLPHPLFDTQVAAMVCGYGESIGYLNLVGNICGEKIDKGPQFTDWSRRPLSDKQLTYALGDVTWLRDVYKSLSAELKEQNRTSWVDAEMDILTSTSTYENHPKDSWRRIKVKTDKPKVLAVLQEVTAWREREAQHRDVPRNRVVRDDTLVDLAVHAPKTVDALTQIRNISTDMARGRLGKALLDAVHKGLAVPHSDCPTPVKKERFPQELTPVLEMLKMLLRIQCSEHDVAAKLVASAADLEVLAQHDEADIPLLTGWRYAVFGKEALALKKGDIMLGLKDGQIVKQKAD